MELRIRILMYSQQTSMTMISMRVAVRRWSKPVFSSCNEIMVLVNRHNKYCNLCKYFIKMEQNSGRDHKRKFYIVPHILGNGIYSDVKCASS